MKARKWVKINDDTQGKYNNSSIKFKSSMIRSDLYDYSDTCILVSGTITIAGEGDDDAAKGADKRNKREIFQNCALFTEWERS